MSIAQRLPILWLTVRQLRAGKATLVVALFAAAPVLFAMIFALSRTTGPWTGFLADTYLQLLGPTVIPLATLIVATNVLGNEIADRTLPYLTLKPIGRWRIVVAKYLGGTLVASVTFLVSYLLAWVLIAATKGGAEATALVALVAGTFAGIVAYGALFLLVSLVVPRALLAGVMYVLLWESLLARFIPGIKLLSVRHFSESVFVRVLDNPGTTLDGALQLPSAIAVLLVVTLLSLTLATLRLRSMNLT